MDLIKDTLKWALPSAKIAYKMTATNAEAFCRHSFGQRYAPSLIGSFLFCFAFTSLMRAAAPERASRLLDIYLMTFFILLLFHLSRMWRPRAVPSHSYANGQSWPIWRRLPIRNSLVQSLVEPGLHAVAGLLVFPVDKLLFLWLEFSGICLFVKELIGKWKRRSRILDALDARAEGERMNTAIRQQTAPQSAGEGAASPVVAAQPAQSPPNSLTQIARNLDPALQRLIATPERRAPTQPPANSEVARPRQLVTRPSHTRYHAGPLGTLPRITSKRPS